MGKIDRSMTMQPQGGNKPPQGGRTYRISPRVRQAIDAMVTDGCSQTKAAERAGMDRSALNRALQKPHIAAELEAAKVRYIQAALTKRDYLKARAVEVAAELMEEADSESVRMRAVEFLAGESKAGPSVSVTVNNSPGYEYVRPGYQVVTIEGRASDSPSGGVIAQAIDDNDE